MPGPPAPRASRSRRWSTRPSSTPPAAAPVRAALGIAADAPLVGWVGRLDRKKRVEDFLDAAALVHAAEPATRFLVIGGPDAFMPEYAAELRARATALGLDGALRFLGDRAGRAPPPRGARRLRLAVPRRGHAARHRRGRRSPASPPSPRPTTAPSSRSSTAPAASSSRTRTRPPPRPPSSASSASPSSAAASAPASAPTSSRSYAAAAVVPQWQALFDAVLAEQPARPAADALPELPAGRLGMLLPPPAAPAAAST